MTGTQPDTADQDLGDVLSSVRRLAREVLGPAEVLLDELESVSAIAESPVFVAAVGQVAETGLTRLSLAEEHGGVGAGHYASYMASEQIAIHAPGFAGRILLQDLLTSTIAEAVFAWGLPSAREWFLEVLRGSRDMNLAWAVLPYGDSEGLTLEPSGLGFHITPNPDYGPGILSRDGSKIVLHDVHIPRVSNAAWCQHLLLFVETAQGSDCRITPFLVPIDGPGISRDPTSAVSGLRLQGHADLHIDGLVLTEEHMLSDPQHGCHLLESLLTRLNTGSAVQSVGVAQAAYLAAFEYTRTRVQGGIPIIGHEVIADALWRAETSIAATREFGKHAARSIDNHKDGMRIAAQARSQAAEMVIEVAQDMLALLGAYGVSNEYPLAKLYRDACVLSLDRATLEGEGVFAHISI